MASEQNGTPGQIVRPDLSLMTPYNPFTSGDFGTRSSAPVSSNASHDPSLVDIPAVIWPQLTKALEQLKAPNEAMECDSEVGSDANAIKVGNPCYNKPCKAAFTATDADNEACLYHPGTPVFHEGMKFWSCCQRKTSDFSQFLNQEGCTQGKHLWIKPKEETSADDKTKTCRFAWHQTPPLVTLTIFSKLPIPSESFIKVSSDKLSLLVTFGEDRKQFANDFNLGGIVNLTSPDTKVIFTPTKVEINLKKAEGVNWKLE